MGHRHQGPAGDSPDHGVQALASGPETQDQAETFWCPPAFSARDPRRADQELCHVGLRVQGGHFRPWDPVLFGQGADQGGGLGRGEDTGNGGEVLGDPSRHTAEVRRLWEMTPEDWEQMGINPDPAH